MGNKKVKLAISIVFIFILVAILVLIINIRKNNSVTLSGSDILASNLQYVESVNNESKLGEIFFYTGSNIAKLNFDSILSKSDSQGVFKEIPFGDVSKVLFSADKNIALIRLEVGTENHLSEFLPEDSGIPKGGQVWVKVNKDSSIELFNPTNNPVVDTYIDDGYVYSLIYQSSEKYTLLKTDLTGNKSVTINDNNAGNQIIGVSGNSVITRNIDDLIITGSSSGERTLNIGYGDVYYDKQSDSILVSDNQKLSIANINSLELKEKNPPVSLDNIFYAGKGMVIGFDNKNSPSKLYYIDLVDSKEWESLEIEGESNIFRSPIESVVIIKKDPLVVAVVTNTSDLGIVANTEIVVSSKPYKLVSIDNINTEAYTATYSIGVNTLQIGNISGNLSAVRSSASSIKSSCECDLNQVNKRWARRSPLMGDGADISENYTGDGVPPELQP